ncbi:MAG: pyrimidine dimer DNA glycosylase/endonuclease V [Thermodesulfobacteriota bacterium]|nr:pyrimidine dimer DNA glycosylase/endonuclease V [Thermodesulfobacteriota bacterium]
MRLWSVHPKYLDQKGLVALWREGLLAQKVLEGGTKAYKNHPQLRRFKDTENPIGAIGLFLEGVYQEAKKRGYHFDRGKISEKNIEIVKIAVHKGQLEFERNHLKKKLYSRDKGKYELFYKSNEIEVNPVFKVVEGEIEDWEKGNEIKEKVGERIRLLNLKGA